MKLAEFNAFCWRQWEDGGVVESMRLPADDLHELGHDTVASELLLPGADGRTVWLGRIGNPASQTAVELDLTPEDGPATAVVKYGPTATTRTVAVGF